MTDERIIAYLLEELTEEESERFEDECFAQETWPSQLEATEDALIEDYLHGELAAERRLRFERNYLTMPARVERVRLAAALLRYVDEEGITGGIERGKAEAEEEADEPPSAGWFRTFWQGLSLAPRAAVAVAALAVVALPVLFVVGQLGDPMHPPSPTVATLTLTVSQGDRAAGAEADNVILPPGASALGVSLILPEHVTLAAPYRVELENDSGEKLAAQVVGHDARRVNVLIPAAQLARGQYALKLFAVQTDGTERRVSGSYLFSVN